MAAVKRWLAAQSAGAAPPSEAYLARLDAERAREQCDVCGGEGQLEEPAAAAGDRALRPSMRRAQHVVTWCRYCPEDVRLGRLRGVSRGDVTECTFERFQPAGASLRGAMTAAMRWASRQDARPFLVLSGPAGVGKSHLAKAAAVQMALAGYGVVFCGMTELLDALKASFDGKDDRAEGRVNAVYGAHVLVLDDVGAERATDWSQAEVRKLLMQRYERRALTVVTTNFTLGEIAARQLDDPNGRLVSRLADVERSALVRVDGEDYRLRRRTRQEARVG